MRKLTVALVLSLFALGLFATAPATADSWTWRDPGGRGPLAISSIKVGHYRPSGAPKLTVTFNRALKASQMGRKDFIVVDYEGNGKRPSDGWIYVVARNGRFESFEYNPTTDETYGTIGFERPTARSLRVVPWNYQSGGYAVAAISYSENAAAGCGGGCWDAAPNRGLRIHDWAPPTFERFVAPAPTDGFWYEPTVPVTWRAVDTGLSRLARTSVVWREPDATRWRTLVTRYGGGPQKANVTAVEGAHMLLQGLAEDGVGNTASSPYPSLLRIPFDDANESGPGTFTGMWTREEDPEAIGGSVNVGTGPATLTFADTANLYCVVVKWLDLEPAQVRLQLDDGTARDFGHDPGDPAARVPLCVGTPSVEEQTATFVVLAGRAGVDGYWSGDDGTSTSQAAAATGHHDRVGHMLGARSSLRSLRRAAAQR
jgi:hypothetical protein